MEGLGPDKVQLQLDLKPPSLNQPPHHNSSTTQRDTLAEGREVVKEEVDLEEMDLGV